MANPTTPMIPDRAAGQVNVPLLPDPHTAQGHGQQSSILAPAVGDGYKQTPYAATWMPHDGSKIEGGPSAGIAVRYALMATHFVLLAVTTIVTALAVSDILFLSIHLALCLAFLIYIPAAFGLTISRKRNHFDHAGGEVAYLVVQWVGWLTCVIISGIYVGVTECGTSRRVYNSRTGEYTSIRYSSQACGGVIATLGLSAAHLALLLGWMIWVVVVVHRASPGYPARAYNVSTAWLLRGWHA